MRQQLLPDPGDVRDLHAHAMGVVVELSLHSPDHRVRFQAATWLREETGKLIEERKKLEQAVEPSVAQERSVLVAELREIYATALPKFAQRPLVEEVVAEDRTAGEIRGEMRPVKPEILERPIARPGHFPQRS
jgi:hypothetical protein